MVEIAGYNVYPAFWVLLILIVGIVSFFIVFVKKIRISKMNQRYSKITTKQREILSKIIGLEVKDYLAHDETSRSDSFVRQMKAFLKYIKVEKKWNVEGLLSIDSSLICKISKILFNWVIECGRRNQKDKMCYLLFIVDAINGGPSFDKEKMNWLIDDIPEIPISKNSTAQDERLLGLSDQIVSDFQDIKKDYEQIAVEFPLLNDFDEDEVFVLKEKISELDGSVFTLTKKEQCLLAYISLYFVNSLWNEMTTGRISEYRICYLRAAVSCLQCVSYDKYLLLSNK